MVPQGLSGKRQDRPKTLRHSEVVEPNRMAQAVDPNGEQLTAVFKIARHSSVARLRMRKTPALPGAPRYNGAPRSPVQWHSPDDVVPTVPLVSV